MEPENKLKDMKLRTIELSGWMTGFILFTFIIPGILILALPSDTRPSALAILTAIPFIEYAAVSVGIGLKIDFAISFFLTVFPCIGLTMLMIGIFGFLGDSSKRTALFLKSVQKRIDKYPRLKKYGVVSNLLFIIFLGIYIAPGISIILGWSRTRSILFMAAGICLITLVIGLATLGIIDLFFV